MQGSGFEVLGSRFWMQGLGFGVQRSLLRVQGAGCRLQASGFRVQGAGFRVYRRRVPILHLCYLVWCKGLRVLGCGG